MVVYDIAAFGLPFIVGSESFVLYRKPVSVNSTF